MPPPRSVLLWLFLSALPAVASPVPRDREARSSPAPSRQVEVEQPEWLELGSVEGSSIDGPGVIGLCTALAASFLYARRGRRAR